MNQKVLSFIGIFGVSLFIISSIVGGFLIENYNWISQYISESYAIDTEYGFLLRVIGYIPSGILIALFCFLITLYFKESKLAKIGFYGLGFFYGIATIIVSIFPCDAGCNKEFINPSISQVIHSLTGTITYFFAPICIIIIGFGLKKHKKYHQLSTKAIAYSIISLFFISLLSSDTNSLYIGLYQRIIEGMFILWIITCAIFIKKNIIENE